VAVSDYQASFNGLTFGAGTQWPFIEIVGLEEFAVRNTDTPAPTLWGLFPGVDYASERVITMTVLFIGDPSLVYQFEAAFLPSSTALLPFVYKLPGREEMTVSARCRRRSRPVSKDSQYGLLEFVVELDAPDPRRYSNALQQSQVSPFVSGSAGLKMTVGAGTGLGFLMNVGAGTGLGLKMTSIAAFGAQALSNNGNVDTYPTFVFTNVGTGMSSWTVINDTTGISATFNQTVQVGDTFTVTMGAVATPTSGLPVNFNGVSRYGTWQVPRLPLSLAPGVNSLRYIVNSGDAGNARCLATWRNAYL